MTLSVLLARGTQDGYLDKNKKFFNSKKQLLNSQDQHSDKIVIYQEIKTKNGVIDSETTGDMFDNLDLVYEGTEPIRSIKCYIGGVLADSFDSDDFVTQVNTLCSFYGNRRIRTVNGKTLVPLELFPFHNHNIMSHLSLRQHDIRIVVNDFDTNYKLYGNVYFLSAPLRHDYFNEQQKIHNCGIQSVANTFQLTKGTNRVGLPSHGLYHLLYFWGPVKINNVKMFVNGRQLFDLHVDLLDHLKLSLGYTCEPHVIFFTQDKVENCGQTLTNTINTTRFDNVILEVDACDDGPLYVSVLKVQYMQIKDGMSHFLM